MNTQQAVAQLRKDLADAQAILEILNMMASLPAAEIVKRYEGNYVHSMVTPAIDRLTDLSVIMAIYHAEPPNLVDLLLLQRTQEVLCGFRKAGEVLIEIMQTEEARELMKSVIFRAKTAPAPH